MVRIQKLFFLDVLVVNAQPVTPGPTSAESVGLQYWRYRPRYVECRRRDESSDWVTIVPQVRRGT